MQTIDNYSGNDLLYLNPKGFVPSQAVINKGERRENPFKEKKRFNATSFSLENEKLIDLPDEDEEDVKLNRGDLMYQMFTIGISASSEFHRARSVDGRHLF